MKKIVVISLVALAACQRGDSPKPDSALARDLALASQMQAQRPVPQFEDSAPKVAQASAPTHRIDNAPRVRQTSRPAVTPPAEPARRAGPSVGAGASFSLASQQRICTSANRPGDRFVATVSNTITGSNGASIPAGTAVVLEVSSVTPPGNGSDGAIGFTVNSIELNGHNYPVSGDVYSAAQLEKVRLNGSSDAKKVAGGAAVGALIGQLMKHNTKGTVIGAAAGAATGAVAAKMTEKYDGCLPTGAPMRMTLSSALLM